MWLRRRRKLRELDVSLPVAIRHTTCIDGGEANVPEAKDRVDERMYLDVSLPVAVRQATGTNGGAVNVPEARDRVDERMYLDVSLPVAVRHTTGIDGTSCECARGEGQSR
jgi:hypothetical protein